MRTVISMLTVLIALTFAAAAHPAEKDRGGGGAAHAARASKSETPVANVKTVEVPEEVVWDFMVWTDSTGKRQVRTKPLSLDGKEVHMEKRSGSCFDVSVDRLCKEDQKLLSEVYSAEKARKQLLAEREAFQDAVKKALEANPDETAVRQAELQKDREEEFLKSNNGKDFDLCFPIRDISAGRQPNSTLEHRSGHKATWDGNVPAGCYALNLGVEEIRKGVMCKPYQQKVKLSATEAAWVEKGDRLVIRGKASFLFGSGEWQTLQGAWYEWHGSRGGGIHEGGRGRSGRTLILSLENPTFTIERTKTDSSLKEKIKARALELKAIEAKEEEAAKAEKQRQEKSNPFNDK